MNFNRFNLKKSLIICAFTLVMFGLAGAKNNSHPVHADTDWHALNAQAMLNDTAEEDKENGLNADGTMAKNTIRYKQYEEYRHSPQYKEGANARPIKVNDDDSAPKEVYHPKFSHKNRTKMHKRNQVKYRNHKRTNKVRKFNKKNKGMYKPKKTIKHNNKKRAKNNKSRKNSRKNKLNKKNKANQLKLKNQLNRIKKSLKSKRAKHNKKYHRYLQTQLKKTRRALKLNK